MPPTDASEHDLKRLGVDPRHAEVLALLPLVYVAWADGKMERVEQERIIAVARVELELDESTLELIASWLRRPPTLAYYRLGLRVLRGLARAPDAAEVDVEDLQRFVVYAESVARAQPRLSDSPWASTPVEERARSEVAAALGVDLGESWSRLLYDLGERPGEKSA